HLQRLLEAADELAGRSQGDAEGAVLERVPAGAQAEREAAAAEVVEGGRGNRQPRRVVEAGGEHQVAYAHAACAGGQRGPGRERLVNRPPLLRFLAAGGGEVVREPDRVVAERLDPVPERRQLRPGDE